MLERLKALFRRKPERPESELDLDDPRSESELPAGELTGLTSPLDIGGEGGPAQWVDDEPTSDEPFPEERP
jgi:hypothetical protein